MMNRSETGALGEKLARALLKKRGYHIIETNFRCREGEIDIVARQQNCLVFVEVRTKTSLGFGTPEESITAAKRRKMRVTARRYCQSHEGLPEAWRIDFVAVELNDRGQATRVEVFENAVGEE
jgi:putative endonuclease